MLNLILMFRRFYRAVLHSITEPEFQALSLFIVSLLVSGTFFYHFVEKWSILDSFYFTVVTLATVGYGDFSPHTVVGKLFTIFYIFIGVGTLLSFITIIAKNALEQGYIYKKRIGKETSEREKHVEKS